MATQSALLGGIEPDQVIVLVMLIVCTTAALFSRIMIPSIVLLICPILGQATEGSPWVTLPVGALDILGVWLLIFGGITILFQFKSGNLLKEKLVLIVLAFGFLALLSVIQSPAKVTTLKEVIRFAAATIMLPVSFLLAKQPKKRLVIVVSIFISLIIPSLVGLYQKITGDIDLGGTLRDATEIDEELYEAGMARIYSTFWGIQGFAKYLIILISTTFSFFVLEKRKNTKFICFGFFAIAFAMLIFTYSRGGLISVMLSLISILYAANKLRFKFVITLLPIILVFLLTTGVFSRFADVFKPVDWQSAKRENSLESRGVIWSQALPLALQRPIQGHGLGTFSDANDKGKVAHNDYLGLFYELGIGGPILHLLFLAMASRKAFVCSRNRQLTFFDRSIALSTFGSSNAIILWSNTENIFQSTIMWWFYLALLGCLMNVDNIEKLDNQKA
ncbi:MAG: O-antigen ligase family protein [Phormidium sp.]